MQKEVDMMQRLMLAAAIILALQFVMPVSALADSCADFLFEDTEEFCEPDTEDGPWVYQSENLTVCIRKTREYCRLCYVADIYIRGNEKAYTGWANREPLSGCELPCEIARRYSAVFGLMGDFLSYRGNRKGVMIRDGNVYYDKADADVLAVLPSGEMEVYEKGTVTADQLLSQGVADSFAFGPILVPDGEMTNAVSTHFLKGHNERTGIGKIEDGHYVAIVSQSNLTFTEFSQAFLNYGCKWVYNMDGGLSTSMIIMGEQVNDHNQRAVSDILLIGTSGLFPGAGENAACGESR